MLPLHFKKFFIVGILGNAMEWYDYALFNSFAPVFAKLFFPAKNPTTALLMTFSVFAMGFAVRPIGGVIFGFLGDLKNRKTALMGSVLLMTIPTVMLGFLPTYQSIGIAAPLIFVLIRLLQGISIGGELPGSILLLNEASPTHKGLLSSFPVAGAFSGLTLGAMMGLIIFYSCSEQTIYAGGWRIPFIASLVLAWIVYYIRHRFIDSFSYEQQKIKDVCRVIMLFKWRIFRLILMEMVSGVCFYVMLVFLNTSLIQYLNLSPRVGMLIYLSAMFYMFLLTPLGGWLGDQMDRRKVLQLLTLILAVLSPLLIHSFYAGNRMATFVVLFLFTTSLTLYFGVMAAFLVDNVNVKLNYTPIAIAHNLAFAIFGGTTPAITTYLVNHWADPTAMSVYMVVASLVSFAALAFNSMKLTVAVLQETFQ